MRAFVTGTDTGVGKTYFTALLARALRRSGADTIALKPVCCGDRTDAHILRVACDQELSLEEVNPLWLPEPVAPAAATQPARMSLQDMQGRITDVMGGRRSVLIEGAGGWLVPLDATTTMADLAQRIGFPVLVVVANRLGCLNHTLLTLESIRARGLHCAGLVLNSGLPHAAGDASRTTNRATLEMTTGAPVLFELQSNQTSLALPSAESASDLASEGSATLAGESPPLEFGHLSF